MGASPSFPQAKELNHEASLTSSFGHRTVLYRHWKSMWVMSCRWAVDLNACANAPSWSRKWSRVVMDNLYVWSDGGTERDRLNHAMQISVPCLLSLRRDPLSHKTHSQFSCSNPWLSSNARSLGALRALPGHPGTKDWRLWATSSVPTCGHKSIIHQPIWQYVNNRSPISKKTAPT